MSTPELVGVIWVCCGLAMLVLGRLMESFAARSYSRSHPGQDVDRYIRRQRLQYRTLAALGIIAGVILLVYRLSGGQFEGE